MPAHLDRTGSLPDEHPRISSSSRLCVRKCLVVQRHVQQWSSIGSHMSFDRQGWLLDLNAFAAQCSCRLHLGQRGCLRLGHNDYTELQSHRPFPGRQQRGDRCRKLWPYSWGGAGRAVPPGGTGVVRMWHLQAIRDLLVYAFDRHDAQLPIDLTDTSSNSADKRTGLGTMLKKTFAKQKGKADAKNTSDRRSASSASLSATVQPLPRPNITAPTPQGGRGSPQGTSSRLHGDRAEQSTRSENDQTTLHDQLRSLSSSQTSPSSVKHQREDAHAAAVSLAKSSVPIRPPPHATSSSQGNNASFSSLFADDLIQSFSGTRQSGGKGKDREADSQAASKGVLFFSVHEADKNTKGSGTWYLAITYARSVMVYEASVSNSKSSRSWSFVKELYAPFPVKAVAFAPVAVPDEPELFTGLGTVVPGASTTFLRVASAEGPLSTSKKGSLATRVGRAAAQALSNHL